MNKIPHTEVKPAYHKPVTWILVADGSKARVYTRQKVRSVVPVTGDPRCKHYKETQEYDLLPLYGMKWKAESVKDYDMTNRGHPRERSKSHQYAARSQSSSDIGRDLKLRFMKTLAEEIETHRKDKLFDRLVLIAPPKLLKELKKHLCHYTLELVAAELPKEMTNCRKHDLTTQLRKLYIVNS